MLYFFYIFYEFYLMCFLCNFELNQHYSAMMNDTIFYFDDSGPHLESIL